MSEGAAHTIQRLNCELMREKMENDVLRKALGQISRMKGHPDKVVVLTTLGAAIQIAKDALQVPTSEPPK